MKFTGYEVEGIEPLVGLEGGKAFHAFHRFRTSHLRKNRVPWDLQKL
jgi:hypothetical protein